MALSKIIKPGDLGGPEMGPEIQHAVELFMRAVMLRFPALGDAASKGFSIQLTLSDGVGFVIQGRGQSRGFGAGPAQAGGRLVP